MAVTTGAVQACAATTAKHLQAQPACSYCGQVHFHGGGIAGVDIVPHIGHCGRLAGCRAVQAGIGGGAGHSLGGAIGTLLKRQVVGVAARIIRGAGVRTDGEVAGGGAEHPNDEPTVCHLGHHVVQTTTTVTADASALVQYLQPQPRCAHGGEVEDRGWVGVVVLVPHIRRTCTARCTSGGQCPGGGACGGIRTKVAGPIIQVGGVSAVVVGRRNAHADLEVPGRGAVHAHAVGEVRVYLYRMGVAGCTIHAGPSAAVLEHLNPQARSGNGRKVDVARGVLTRIEVIPHIIVRGVATATAGRSPRRGARGFVACAGAVGIGAQARGIFTFVVRGAGANAHGEGARHTAGNPHVVHVVCNGGYGVVRAVSAVHAGAAASIGKHLNAHAGCSCLGEVHEGGSARGGIEVIPHIVVCGVATATAGRSPRRGAGGFVTCAVAVGHYGHVVGVVAFIVRGDCAYAHGEGAGHAAGNPHVVHVVCNGGHGVIGAASAVHAGAAAGIGKHLNAHAARARLGEVHEGGSARGGLEVVPHIVVRSVATAAAGRGPGRGARGFVACAVAVG